MIFKPLLFKCVLLVALTSTISTLAQPEKHSVTTLSADNIQQIQSTLKEVLPLYRMTTKAAHKEHHHGRLSVVHLILIIGKVLAPLVGAIIEPLLINIAKGITWAITYSLATGFDKPQSYEHFVPALEHHSYHGNNEDADEDYESHKPITYSLKELPGLALQLTNTVLSGSGQLEHLKVMENAEKKLVRLLLQTKVA